MGKQNMKELEPNEIIFMSRMEKEILPDRKHINSATLKEVGALVGISINTSCRSCIPAGGADMLNLYGQLKVQYGEYMKELKDKEPIYTKYEESEIQEEPIEEVLPVIPNTPKKKSKIV